MFLGSVVLTMFRERFSQAITAALLWVVVGLVLVVAYSYRFELHDVADRVLVVLVPGHVVVHGRASRSARANGGDFAVAAQINGARVADGARYRRKLGGAHPATTPRQPACRSKCSTTRSISTPPTAAPAPRR